MGGTSDRATAPGAADGSDPPASASAVELRGVSKVYREYGNEVRAVDHVSFAVAPGELVGVVGPSGSGKSTLLNLLGLLDKPTNGEVLVDGRATSHLSGADVARFRGRTVGFVFQNANLIPRFTALENVVLPAMIQGRDGRAVKERGLDLLDRVGIRDRADHRGVHLSGGEQQRVAIARALINDPTLVLADEPTGSLDTEKSDEVMAILQDLHGEGRTIVMVTHDLEIARRLGRVVEIEDGRIVRDGDAGAGNGGPGDGDAASGGTGP